MSTTNEPIPMLLHCPLCKERHIDEGEFATKVHHTHACQSCGHVWRPAIVPTVGVRFLPGFKNDTLAPSAPARRVVVDGILRRSRLDKMTPAETCITQAISLIETMGADDRLTNAQILLEQARDKVADCVDVRLQDLETSRKDVTHG